MTAAYFEDHPTDPEKVILRKPRLDQGPDYERGFIDGMQYQMQSSVDRAVNAMTQPTYYIPSNDQRTWVGLEGEEIRNLWEEATKPDRSTMTMVTSFAKSIEAKLKQKNHVAQETN